MSEIRYAGFMSDLLDSCVIFKCIWYKPDLQVKIWFNQQSKGRLFLSVMTIAEI